MKGGKQGEKEVEKNIVTRDASFGLSEFRKGSVSP